MPNILPTDINNTPLYGYDLAEQIYKVANYRWDVDLLEWVRDTGAGEAGGGDVTVLNWPDSVAVTGPITDAELRADPIPVLGPLTDAELRADPVPVLGPVTDAELRATPVPVSGSVSVGNFPATQPVSGPLTNAELRAATVAVIDERVSEVLQAIFRAVAYPAWIDRSANQLRAQVTGTLTTVTTVTGLTNVGASFTGDMLQRSMNYNAWANVQRRTIS